MMLDRNDYVSLQVTYTVIHMAFACRRTKVTDYFLSYLKLRKPFSILIGTLPRRSTTHMNNHSQVTYFHVSILAAISFIHPGYFYSAYSSPLLLRGASYTAQILCRSFAPKGQKLRRVKDLPKVPTWRLERDSNPRPFGQKHRIYQ